jgi:hypothetical protein
VSEGEKLSLKDLVSHLKRLNGMGLEDSKILQAVKCWVIHSVDDRQTMGYMVSNFVIYTMYHPGEITYHITHCLSVIYTVYHPGEITYHITHCLSVIYTMYHPEKLLSI